MYYYQGNRINHGAAFVPSFSKLDEIYQAMKNHAGPGVRVEVHDADYLHQFNHDYRVHWDAELIKRYVSVREKEAGLSSANQSATVVYQLWLDSAVPPGDPDIGYGGQGLALKAAHGQPPKPK